MVWLWVVGVVLSVVAGFVVTYVPWARARSLGQRTAWSAAHAAIDRATVSRDATSGDLPVADGLLARARSLAAHHGGVAAAREAAECAARADGLYREAAGE